MFNPFSRPKYDIATAAWDAVAKAQIVVQFSLGRQIMYCNKLFEKFAGYDHDEAIGMEHSQLCRP